MFRTIAFRRDFGGYQYMSGFPITDDHIHIDPVNGRGIEAAREFRRSGGTHIFLVSKPAGSFGIRPGAAADFIPVFEETLRVAEKIRETGVVVFPVLGVHPAEITHLAEATDPDTAAGTMKGGLDLAARYVEEGKAIALKSGRPHYEVSPEIWSASLDVLSHALSLAAGLGCALQVHAESGPCADIAEMAGKAGMRAGKVVKHYATTGTPLVPSVTAKGTAFADFLHSKGEFMLESDYMDENSRPGAVTGPRSVPRMTRKLYDEGLLSEDDVYRIHVLTPSRVYGVDISL
ncbi:MAG: TatD family hydrolase [Methanoregulaceae archaeon]|nr:TatD family hydrolase [Methanoregulaceae archaeon]